MEQEIRLIQGVVGLRTEIFVILEFIMKLKLYGLQILYQSYNQTLLKSLT